MVTEASGRRRLNVAERHVVLERLGASGQSVSAFRRGESISVAALRR